MALGARIKEARGDLGWDQAALCARVHGLTQQALSNLETRDSKTSEFAIRIADALGVSIRWLLDGAGRKGDRDWPFARVERSRWDACSPEDRGFVEGAISRALEECERARSQSGGANTQQHHRGPPEAKAA
jgi:transcriptional regulator with XRE-family HTH domain